MFKHTGVPEVKPDEEVKDDLKPEVKKPAEESLEDLIKKNLKWSQIIYEQNRKIGRRLLMSAIASWFYLIILVVPIILSLIFLPPLLKDVFSQYGDLLGTSSVSGTKQNSLDSLIKMLNLDPAKQEQLKTILK